MANRCINNGDGSRTCQCDLGNSCTLIWYGNTYSDWVVICLFLAAVLAFILIFTRAD